MHKTYTAIALDDESPALDVLAHFCHKIDNIASITTFTSATKALEYLENNEVDIFFLDVEMPGISGLDIAKKYSDNLEIIFTTAFENYALEGFELSVTDYLLKPFTLERLQKAVERAVRNLRYQRLVKPTDGFITVKANYANQKIKLEDIAYIESINNNLTVHLNNDEPISFRASLRSILQDLPASDFIRIHRSYIVPVRRVDQYTKKMIKLGAIELPIGLSYAEETLSKLDNHGK